MDKSLTMIKVSETRNDISFVEVGEFHSTQANNSIMWLMVAKWLSLNIRRVGLVDLRLLARWAAKQTRVIKGTALLRICSEWGMAVVKFGDLEKKFYGCSTVSVGQLSFGEMKRNQQNTWYWRTIKKQFWGFFRVQQKIRFKQEKSSHRKLESLKLKETPEHFKTSYFSAEAFSQLDWLNECRT